MHSEKKPTLSPSHSENNTGSFSKPTPQSQDQPDLTGDDHAFSFRKNQERGRDDQTRSRDHTPVTKHASNIHKHSNTKIGQDVNKGSAVAKRNLQIDIDSNNAEKEKNSNEKQ